MRSAILLSLLFLSGCTCFSGDTGLKIATGALLTSSIVDAATSNAAFRRGNRELNPIAKPFVGGAGTYAFAVGTTALLVGGACYLKSRGFEYYKAPLWIGTGAHTAASISNGGE